MTLLVGTRINWQLSKMLFDNHICCNKKSLVVEPFLEEPGGLHPYFWTLMSSKNPSVKRIQREIAEILSDHSDFYSAAPLEDNLFEWHFTIAGPKETEFEGGLYHGKILLPSEYPFKPPWIEFKTPNGRFQLHQKICLSVTAHHPEEWNPSWGIRTVLLGIISHFPVEDKSSIGYLDYSKEERKKLARESVDFVCPTCNASNKSLLPSAFPAEPVCEHGIESDGQPKRPEIIEESQKPARPSQNRFFWFLACFVLLVGIFIVVNKKLLD